MFAARTERPQPVLVCCGGVPLVALPSVSGVTDGENVHQRVTFHFRENARRGE